MNLSGKTDAQIRTIALESAGVMCHFTAAQVEKCFAVLVRELHIEISLGIETYKSLGLDSSDTEADIFADVTRYDDLSIPMKQIGGAVLALFHYMQEHKATLTAVTNANLHLWTAAAIAVANIEKYFIDDLLNYEADITAAAAWIPSKHEYRIDEARPFAQKIYSEYATADFTAVITNNT